MLFTFGVISGGGAEEATLKIGDSAPPLQTGKWIQGEPVKEFAKDKVYLVEFWATWCGPCRTTIPHLNDLHQKYQDQGLVVIGQDVWEQDESEVPKFVKSMGNKMTYRVVLDNKEGSEKGKMAETWMKAAGRNGIPSAFLVNQEGRIAWIGHPMELEEALLEKVLTGNYDLAQAAADQAQQEKLQTRAAALWRQFSEAMGKREWDKAEAALNETEKIMPPKFKTNLELHRLRFLLNKQDTAGACQLARRLSDANQTNPPLQNQLAWILATTLKEPSSDCLKIAEKSAMIAVQASESSATLDTLARIQFLKGEKDKAVATQEKAVKLASGPQKSFLEKNLASYKEGRLPSVEE